MQEWILGSLCFLVFLLSFGLAQNSVDLRTGYDEEDDFNLNAEPGAYLLNPYGSLDSYSDDAGQSRAILIPGGFGSNYATAAAHANADSHANAQAYANAEAHANAESHANAQAHANAESLAHLNYNGPPYNSDYFGAGSGFPYSGAVYYKNEPLNLAEADDASDLSSSYSLSDLDGLTQASESDLRAYGPGYFAKAQAQAQSNVFSNAHSSNIMSSEADAYSQAIGSGLGSGNNLGLNQYGSGISSANANAHASSFGSSSSFASATSNVESPSFDEGSNLFGFGLGSSSASAQALSGSDGVRSRIIPREEYINIPAGDGIFCSSAGELHNVWSPGYNCLICACVLQNGYLGPVCVSCDLCTIPVQPLPAPTYPPLPPAQPTPAPTVEVSCDPLPTNTPFQNPLNHCQICICQHSFGFEPDVRITCEDIPTCDLPQSDSVIIPPIPDPLTPVPLPTCEKFPPNVVFPHPFDICQSCECMVVNSIITEYNVVCYPTPGCEPLLPPLPSLPQTTTTTPVPPTPPTELLPWPPLPPGPLPGPLPHKSCAPYPPNQQFQHPWDDCQICVCSEIYSTGVVNIEVNCFTNPVCCREYPVMRPYGNLIDEHGSIPSETQGMFVIPGSVPVPKQNIQLQYLDNACKSRDIDEDFFYDRCRICSCQIFGNIVAPVCKHSYMPECVNMPAPVPVGNIVYLEPKCRHRPPLQSFHTGCNNCICQTVFNFVVADCKPVPGCDKGQYSQNSQGSKAEAFANSQAGSYNYGYTGSHPSLSMAEANAAATLGSSGTFEYGGYPHKTLSDMQGLYNEAYKHLGSQYLAESNAGENGGYQPLIPTVTQMGLHGYPHNLQNSQSLAEASAISTSGSSGVSEYGALHGYPHGFQSSQSLAEANQATSESMASANSQAGSSLSYPYGTLTPAQSNAFLGMLEGSQLGSFGGYPLTPTSSGYSYANANANAHASSSLSGSYAQAASEAEAIAALHPGSQGQLSPFYRPVIGQQAGNLVQSTADAISHVFSLPPGSVIYGRPKTKSGDPEELDESEERK